MINIDLNEVTIRTELRPGDIGYVTWMHGVLYSSEYGYGINFEAYVAKGLHEFYANYDPRKDGIWIAEHQGKIVGFLLLMHRDEGTSQLRYFILQPEYRGVGLGKKLTVLLQEFLTARKYRRCYLWTTHEQTKAADIYKKMGFRLTEEMKSTAFGKPLKEQGYEMEIN
ncbi:MAG TPA: GNAT family N-acetyltransferase [Mucilaginibacter sp.]|nr:GNAT family N-acetyltransferase [Mucilaginibacter sp.]